VSAPPAPPAPRAPRQPAACRDDRGRRAVTRAAGWNGLDYLEVDADRRELTVLFLAKPPRPEGGLAPRHFVVEGGGPEHQVRITSVRTSRHREPGLDECVVLTLDRLGDGSCYTLRLVGVERIDPLYQALEFTFLVDCPDQLDCKPVDTCPPPELAEPELDYLAKDYASLRRLVLDRLALVLPAWRERHVPDAGIVLAELLAYVGDTLSYYQDAVATEAYLDTARQRTSVRRHLRLVDYHLHEGCNARAFVQVACSDPQDLPAGAVFFVAGFQDDRLPDRILTEEDLDRAPAADLAVFEPLVADDQAPLRLRPVHNLIRLHTFGLRECCLPAGATAAVLVDSAQRPLELVEGDFLLFEEIVGPETGEPADADPSHRHVARLTSLRRLTDPVTAQPLVEVGWADEDALPFPLCLSLVGPPPACALLQDVSVARGNVVLADHGRRLPPEQLGVVEAEPAVPTCLRLERPADPVPVPAQFSPRLQRAPLVFAEPLPAGWAAATRLVARRHPRLALPWTRLTGAEPVASGEQPRSWPWTARRHLLESGPQDRHVVPEPDDAGRARLRFGDGELGRRPAAGTVFTASYRIGGPLAGVGADTITRIGLRGITLDGVTLLPRNPLPASGGLAPEPVAQARLLAPTAFRRELRRAVTGDDYARLAERDPADPAERNPRVQRAEGRLRWTGSWYEARVAVDACCGPADDRLLADIRAALEPYRRIGHDLAVKRAREVPLDLALQVCVQPSYLRGHVRAALLDALGNRALPGGRRGLFHPDALSFGEPVFLSRIIAAAQAVAGVESVRATRFKRLFAAATDELDTEVLRLHPLEVARLDNDPAFPEHGRLTLDLRGGR
jgi:hypothetical protein